MADREESKMRRVRAVAAGACLAALAACSGPPSRFGITGPSGSPTAATVAPSPDAPPVAAAPEAAPAGTLPTDSLIQPGIPTDTGETYSPSTQPSFGRNGRFFGYD